MFQYSTRKLFSFFRKGKEYFGISDGIAYYCMENERSKTYKNVEIIMYKLKFNTMKKAFLVTATFLLFLSSCNMNPNKEARIQKLETEMQQALDKINKLEATNEQLKTRIIELEKR